jgi:hypothetical protein
MTEEHDIDSLKDLVQANSRRSVVRIAANIGGLIIAFVEMVTAILLYWFNTPSSLFEWSGVAVYIAIFIGSIQQFLFSLISLIFGAIEKYQNGTANSTGGTD